MASIYATVLQVKERLGVPASDERSDDALLGIIEAVSRLIDAECNTQFYAATETLYYTPRFLDELLTDDILSVSSLTTDASGDGTYETTWAPTDYVLAPYNAQTSSQPRPYWRIERAWGGRYSFPAGVPRGVKLTVLRGFCDLDDLPKPIEVVCLRESLFRAQANVSPFGMTSGDGAGVAAPATRLLSNASMNDLFQFKRVAFA